MQDSLPSRLISVEDARATVLGHIRQMPTERVALIESHGRILAQDAASDIDISPFDNSAMDGFAVRFADFEAASVSADAPLTLDIVGVIGAGAVYEGTLQQGQALRIMTGAPLPQGADTVVKIEETTVDGADAGCPEGRRVAFRAMPQRGEHIRPRGMEARKGDVLLRVGERISPPGVGLLASTGNAEVQVYRRPRVAILATGNELVDVTSVPGPGQIRNSNNYALAAAVIEAGGIPTVMPSVEDTREALVEALLAALAAHDFVVTSGGAAEGDYDFITPVVRQLGELFFNKVNMRPGKAQTFGIIEGTPVFGLPGNPGAAFVGFEVLVRPALRFMQGLHELDRPFTMAVLTQDVKKKGEERRCYLRARLERGGGERGEGERQGGGGTYCVTPEPNQSSALLGALNRSNCLLVVPEGPDPLAVGSLACCLRLDREEGTV
ncbi:MAG: molybdopterin molybdotransferase MoeA [Coriobacteriales bacterium]|jgi:molybdopterin molybdotransferase|nr:molybdopterin molybdotransferase MoeA [Coriobacteriales bacterium]